VRRVDVDNEADNGSDVAERDTGSGTSDNGSDTADREDPTAEVRSAVAAFVDELATETGLERFADVLEGAEPTTADLGATPESWTEDTLVEPLLSAAGLEKTPGRPSDYRAVGGDTRRETPDFRLAESFPAVGEVKRPGNLAAAETDLLDDYLTSKAWPDYGVATDGVEWVVYRAEHGGDFLRFHEAARVDLRPAAWALAHERGHLPERPAAADLEPITQFVTAFDPERLEQLLTREAPRALRDDRQQAVDDFYDRYVALLFGEGDAIDTSLRAAVPTPADATDRERDLFVVSLVNRLLFVRILETRGVVKSGLLADCLDHYERHGDGMPSGFHRVYLRRLFDLLNTPRQQRPDDVPERFAEVPYLGAELFRRPEGPFETCWVPDEPLRRVVRELIVGLDPDDGFDPAMLGSVFEKTINHVGGETDRQAAVGAYYTPADVTRHVAERTIDAKVEDLAAETFAAHPADGTTPETVRERVADTELSTLLRRVEEGPGAFGESRAALSALLDAIADLTVLDPACGSGHFLTTAMEELHRVQLSLLRGLADGDPPEPARRYEAKRRLALDVIYGVDVDAVAVEIARLRVWLKMIEGGYQPSYGRLPNVDVNVVCGNSLVGFPAVGPTQLTGSALGGRLDEVHDERQRYKHGEHADPDRVQTVTAEARVLRDEQYLDTLSHTVETTVTEPSTFDAVFASVDPGEIYPTLQSVRARQIVDGEAVPLDPTAKERLAAVGFDWQSWRETNRSARLDVDSVLSRADATTGRAARCRTLLEQLRTLLTEGFTLELERQPTPHDLSQIDAEPLHWGVQFPELRDDDGVNPSVSVDIVLGNPPYGDVLGAEKLFTAPYRTGSIREVSAQFLERQLALLDADGYLGNVTTLRLFYQSSLESLHDLLRDRLSPADVACFGSRPAKLFDDADVRVALLTGRAAEGDGHDGDSAAADGIRTSRFRLFTEDTRSQRFETLSYAPTTGLVLRDRIGGDGDGGPILPKVGTDTVRGLLEQLRAQSDVVFRDRYSRDAETDHPVWRREGVRYWINPMLEQLYDAREVTPIYFRSELERRTAFLVLQSSPYFVYWSAYGNQHHHTWTQLSAFPWPDPEAIQRAEDRVHSLSERLWDGMVDTYTETGRGHGTFDTGRLRPLVDEVDSLVGELYDLSGEQVAVTSEYLTDMGPGLGRAGPDD
jgi:hypothetical protein